LLGLTRRFITAELTMADVTPERSRPKDTSPTRRPPEKLIYLAVTNAVPQWTRTRDRPKVLLAFKIYFGDRLPD
jgi:hypothetical protein